jgi:hypothetical protein
VPVRSAVVATILLASTLLATDGNAAWPNHAINLPVHVAAGTQAFTAIVSDGTGGVIIVWRDSPRIRAIRVLADGTFAWDSSTTVWSGSTFLLPQVVSDGAGGAYIASSPSQDPSSAYVQHLSSDGETLWSVTQTSADDSDIAADGMGGAIFVWESYKSYSTGVNVHVQRFGGSGSLWDVNLHSGVHQLKPSVASDGAGGAFISWEENSVVKAQSLDPLGAARWPTPSVSLGPGGLPRIISASGGSALVAWLNAGSLLVRKIGPSGVPLWGAPLEVGPISGELRVTSTPDGGMILVWEHTDPPYGHLAAQSIQADGTILWEPGGLELDNLGSPNNSFDISPDGSGGVVVTYSDGPGGFNVFAQHISPYGELLWGIGGVPVSSALDDQMGPAVAWAGDAYAISAWTDQRSDGGDIYAQLVDGPSNVSIGDVDRGLAGPTVSPNPFRSDFFIHLSSAHAGMLQGTMFDVRGRRVASSTWNVPQGRSAVHWGIRDAVSSPLEPGVYFVRLSMTDWQREFRVVQVR